MVIAPAKTGSERRSKIAVIKTDQGNIGMEYKSMPYIRKFIIVLIKLIAPRSEEIPAKCKEKMAKSTALPE